MKTIKNAGTAVPVVLLTAVAVLAVGTLIGPSSWAVR